jgi:predicted AAA+ superfamily ATPase
MNLLTTTGGKDEPNMFLCENRNGHHNMDLKHEDTQRTTRKSKKIRKTDPVKNRISLKQEYLLFKLMFSFLYHCQDFYRT